MLRARISLCVLLACSIFTLAAHAAPVTGQTGPGGIESTVSSLSTLELWLNAGSISGATPMPLSNWNNRSTYSGAAVVATQSVSAQQPIYIPSVTALNNQPVVRFDGNPSSGQGDVFDVSGLNLGANASGFVVYLNGLQNTNSGSCCRTIFSENTGGTNIGNNGYSLYLERENINPKRLQISKGLGTTAPTVVQNPFPRDDVFHISGFRSSTANTELRDNGGVLNSGVLGGSPTGTNYQIAGNFGAPARSYAGDIAEVALFNRQVNLAEVAIIENYLSAKYNVAISNNLYDGDNPGTDFDRDVFGVGRVDAGNQALNSGSAGFGIEVIGGGSPADLNDGEFILAGHNQATAGILDLTSGIIEGERWTRIWNVDTNGAEADATLGFSFDDAGLGSSFNSGDSFQLLYSQDMDFSSFEVLSREFDLETGNVITFALDAAQFQDGFYTLGINFAQVPEPGTGGLAACGVMALVYRRRRRNRKHA